MKQGFIVATDRAEGNPHGNDRPVILGLYDKSMVAALMGEFLCDYSDYPIFIGTNKIESPPAQHLRCKRYVVQYSEVRPWHNPAKYR